MNPDARDANSRAGAVGKPACGSRLLLVHRVTLSCAQVNNLREIQALRRLSPHPNIVQLEEVLYDKPTGRLALVFELMDMNLCVPLSRPRTRCWVLLHAAGCIERVV